MGKVSFEDSSIVSNYILEARSKGLILNPENVLHLVEITVAATSDFLQLVKTKEKPVALIFEDLKGNLLLAAIVSYEKNEDESMPGNWVYFWTFDKDDLKDVTKYSINSTPVHEVFRRRAFDLRRLSYQSESYIAELSNLFARLLSEFLEQNAKEGEEFEVEKEGYFVATSTVENGDIIKSFIPDGAMKRLIKDDESASKDVE